MYVTANVVKYILKCEVIMKIIPGCELCSLADDYHHFGKICSFHVEYKMSVCKFSKLLPDCMTSHHISRSVNVIQKFFCLIIFLALFAHK